MSDQLKIGLCLEQLTRIADALERAYPEPDQLGDEYWTCANCESVWAVMPDGTGSCSCGMRYQGLPPSKPRPDHPRKPL